MPNNKREHIKRKIVVGKILTVKMPLNRGI